MRIIVKVGDITQEPADALVAAIDSTGSWVGGIDYAIRDVAGWQYHDVVMAALRQYPDLTSTVARQTKPHEGKFRDVVFVIDDLNEPLRDVVTRGLNAAKDAGAKTITLPMIRFGAPVRFGGTAEEKLRDIAVALVDWRDMYGDEMTSVTVVVYDDVQLMQALSRQIEMYDELLGDDF